MQRPSEIAPLEDVNGKPQENQQIKRRVDDHQKTRDGGGAEWGYPQGARERCLHFISRPAPEGFARDDQADNNTQFDGGGIVHKGPKLFHPAPDECKSVQPEYYPAGPERRKRTRTAHRDPPSPKAF